MARTRGQHGYQKWDQKWDKVRTWIIHRLLGFTSVQWNLFVRRADTKEGNDILREAYLLAHEYPDLSEGECIRLAYWGASGAKD